MYLFRRITLPHSRCQIRVCWCGSLIGFPPVPDSPALLPRGFLHRIMDRAVIVRHLAASATDPFTGRRLAIEMLVPQPELAGAIASWREQQSNARRDTGLNVSSAILERLGGDQLSPEMMTALLEAEVLSNATKRAHAAESSEGAARSCMRVLESNPLPASGFAFYYPSIAHVRLCVLCIL